MFQASKHIWKPSFMFVLMCFDTQNNILDYGGSLKNHQKSPFLDIFGGGGGKTALKRHFAKNCVIFHISYRGVENVPGFKFRLKPFNHVCFDEF